MILSPVFLGAEPDEIDDGPHAGLTGPFTGRITLGTRLMAALPDDAQRLAVAIAEDFAALLPAGPRAARMREIREHLDETWFSWIGGWHPGDVFYYRLQSPVLIAELDHHCGVFLDYQTLNRSTSTRSCAPRTATTTAAPGSASGGGRPVGNLLPIEVA